MLEMALVTINQWIAGGTAIAAVGAFLWGMVSVLLSPCHMASIPLMVAYVGGQNRTLQAREAARYAVAFTSGLFITIALVGVVCALLGRMLGDIGTHWQILVGLLLVWVALGLWGVEKCSFSGGLLQRFNFRGFPGALALGLAYGVLSGSCTFGFIAPILAIITVQERIASGILLIFLFATGHCLPIVFAGSSTALVRNLLESKAWQGAGNWFRRGAGAVVAILAAYFILNPFFGN
jgi:cytochrome c-type biogenesis protein